MNRSVSVVVDPVLCYVSNHRRTVSDHDLRFVISRYFADSAIADAYERLNQQTAPLLDAIDENKTEEGSASPVSGIDSILRIFRLCDRYRITLPEFAVSDLTTLPPPPRSVSDSSTSDISLDDDVAISSIVRSLLADSATVQGSSILEKAASDTLFTCRMLLKIVQELKELKSLVIDLSLKKSAQSPKTIAAALCADFDAKSNECQRASTPDEVQDEKVMMEEYAPSNNSIQVTPPNGDDQKPPSRDSSTSVSRATPVRKRGSSRSSGSIEDVLAKLKARSGENPLSLIFQGGDPNANVADTTDSGASSPKMELDDPSVRPMSADEKSPSTTPIYCDRTRVNNNADPIFPSALAARNLAAAMMEQSAFFLPGGVPRLDLVNSAAAMMAGVFPVTPGGMLAAALSPRARGLPFSTPTLQQPTALQTCFASPSSTTTCVSPLIHPQSVKEPSAFRPGCSTAPSRPIRDGPKPKKMAKQQHALGSPVLSDQEDARKRQQQELSDGDGSIAESSSQGNGTAKPWVCTHENCRKRFTNKFLLKKHEFIHTGLRPHQCPYCLKRFNRKDNLLRHKVTHEKNYTTPRRRSCRVYGVKVSVANPRPESVVKPDLMTASAGSSPSAESKICVQQRSASCAPNESELGNRQPTPTSMASLPQPIPNFHAGPPISTSGAYTLAALASYTALAQSLWPRATVGGVQSMNN